MKKKLVEEYFTFSKKERNAVIVLVILIAGIFILPYCLPHNESVDEEILAAVEKAGIVADDTREEQVAALNKYGSRQSNHYRPAMPAKDIQFFTFDPNTLNPEGWRKLGLKDRTIQTIGNYLSKGGKFRKPEDVKKIFGISPHHAAQLVPYVSIAKEEAISRTTYPDYVQKKVVANKLVDINEADSLTLIALKGIGPKLAGRIIRFRERLGGFHSKEQLKEVYGLPDSTSQQLLPAVVCSASDINKININEADIPILAQHPYIGRSLAKLIVNYREQHGRFEKMADLLGIDIMEQQLIKKLTPYINF